MISWEDYGTAELWAGHVVIDAQHEGPGFEVRFPVGETTVDPTFYATSPGAGLNFQSQRKSFFAKDRHWSFWADNREIWYASSVDGRYWGSGASVGDGLPNSGSFDVAISGDWVVVAWFDKTEFNVRVRSGTLRSGQIDWEPVDNVITSSWGGLYGASENALSVAISTAGFVYIAIATEYYYGGIVVLASDGPYTASFDLHNEEWSCLSGLSGNRGCPTYIAPGTTPMIVPRPDGALTLLFAEPIGWSSQLYWAFYDPWYDYEPSPALDDPWSPVNSQALLGTTNPNCEPTVLDSGEFFSAAPADGGSTAVVYWGDGALKYIELLGQGTTSVVTGPETVVASSGSYAPTYPSIGVDASGDAHVVWLWRTCQTTGGVTTNVVDDLKYSSRYVTADGNPHWSQIRSLATESGPSSRGLSAPHLPADVGPSLLVTWRSKETDGKAEIEARAIQLAVSSEAVSGGVWTAQGLSPTGAYVGENGYAVSSTTGLLTYRTVDGNIEARGLDLILARIYQEPQFFTSRSASPEPYLYEPNPYSAMGDGWGIDMPWATERYFYLPGGGRQRYEWGADGTFQSTAGVPFKAYWSSSTTGAEILMEFSSGTKMILEHKGDAYVVTKAWDGLNFDISDPPPNLMVLSYQTLGSSEVLASITDATGRILQLSYSNGKLSQIDFKTSATSSAHEVRSFGYFTSGAAAGLLEWAEDANGNREQYEYNTAVSGFLLSEITYRQGGFVQFDYHAAVSVGTEASTYPVTGVTLYGIQDSSGLPPEQSPEFVAKSISLDLDMVDGRIYHTRITTKDNDDTTAAIADFVLSPQRGYVEGTDREADGTVLRRNVVWFDSFGGPWKIERYVGTANRPYSTEYVAHDEYGNPIYSRDTFGFEVFASYLNTRDESSLVGAAMLDALGNWGYFTDRFSGGDEGQWTLSGGCPSTGCMDWGNYYFDPPSLRIFDNAGENVATRDIGESTSSPFLSGVFKVSESDYAVYGIVLKDSTSGLVDTNVKILANSESSFPNTFLLRWATSTDPFVEPSGSEVRFSTKEWHSIVMWRQGSTYWVNVDGQLEFQTTAYSSQLPTSVDRLELRSMHNGGPSGAEAEIWFNEISVGSGYSEVSSEEPYPHVQVMTIEGLPDGARVVALDAVGGFIDSAVASAGSVEIDRLGSNSTLDFLITTADGQPMFAGPIGGIGKFSARFSPAPRLGPIVLADTGFAQRIHTNIIYDDPCPTSPRVECANQYEYAYVEDDPINAVAGSTSHVSISSSGTHFHYFRAETHYPWDTPLPPTWYVDSTDFFVQYVYVPPGAPPAEVMLGLYRENSDPTSLGTWHTAYWGQDRIQSSSEWTINSKFEASDSAITEGRWVQLIVKASDLGLDGTSIAGVSWALNGGSARWDLTATARSDIGSITVSNLGSGMYADFLVDGTVVATNTASQTAANDWVSTLNLYNAGYTVFPISGTIRVHNADTTLAAEVPFQNVWGGDQYALTEWRFDEQPQYLVEGLHNLREASASWATGRELLSLDMESRVPSPYDAQKKKTIQFNDVSGNGHNGHVGSWDGAEVSFGGWEPTGGTSPILTGIQVYVPTYGTASGSGALRIPSSAMSLAVAFNPTTIPSQNANLVAFGTPSSSFSEGPWYLELDPYGRVKFHVRFDDGSTQETIVLSTGLSAIEESYWSHVVVTYDGQEARMFLNGVEVDSEAVSHGPIAAASSAGPGLYVSSPSGGLGTTTGLFVGFVGDVKLYGRAISDSEVEQLALGATTTARQEMFGYLANGNLQTAKTQVVDGGPPGYASSALNWVTKHFTFDQFNNLIQTKDELLTETQFVYSGSATPPYTYPIETRRYVLDTQQLPSISIATIKDQFLYDIWGHVAQHTSPEGRVTNFEYEEDSQGQPNAVGRLTEILYPTYVGTDPLLQGARPSESWEYDDSQRLTTHYPLWHSSTIDVSDVARGDGLGRTLYSYTNKPDASGDWYYRTMQYSYDSKGNIQQVTGPDSPDQTSVWTYDAMGRILEETQPPGGSTAPVTTYSYDDAGAAPGGAPGSAPAIVVIDPAGRWTTYRFDAAGRLTDTCQWEDRQSQMDCFGGGGQVTHVDYDLAGQRTRQTNPDGAVVTWTYDQWGRVVRQQGPGTETGLLSKGFNRDTSNHILTVYEQHETATGSFVLEARYDGLGQNYYFHGPNNPAIEKAYNRDGELVVAKNQYTRNDCTYNSWGQVLTQTTTYSVETPGFSKAASFSYDIAMRLVEMTYPDDSKVSYQYDPYDRVHYVTSDWVGVSGWMTRNSYYRTDLPYISLLDNQASGIWMGWQRNERDQVTLFASWGIGNAYSLNYDDSGDVSYKIDLNGAWESYSYDDSDRLNKIETGITNGGGTQYGPVSEFDFDAGGNMVSKSDGTTETTFQYDVGDVLSQMDRQGDSAFPKIPEFNADGQLVELKEGGGSANSWAYEYADDGTLTRVLYGTTGTPTSTWQQKGGYAYTPDGEMAYSNDGGSGPGWYYFAVGGMVLYTWPDEAGPQPRSFAYDGNRLFAMREGSSVYYTFQDERGNLNAITDTSGNVVWEASYSPFGEASVDSGSSISNDVRFASNWDHEPVSLQFFHARWYDPESGRFITSDPIPGSLGVPGTINAYAYSLGNPVAYSDPSGECVICLVMALVTVAFVLTLAIGTMDWWQHDATPQQRAGFLWAIGAAVVVGLSCVVAACSGLAIFAVSMLAGAASYATYAAATRYAGGEPDARGGDLAFAWGTIIGGAMSGVRGALQWARGPASEMRPLGLRTDQRAGMPLTPTPGSSPLPTSRPFAMGVKEHLSQFARRLNAETYKSFPHLKWQDAVRRAVMDRKTPLHFNLDGIPDVLFAASRGLSNPRYATDWELGLVRTAELQGREVHWWLNGAQVSSPFL